MAQNRENNQRDDRQQDQPNQQRQNQQNRQEPQRQNQENRSRTRPSAELSAVRRGVKFAPRRFARFVRRGKCLGNGPLRFHS